MEANRFKKQFFSLHPKLYSVALALVGNKDDAEDLLQEVYCKLWNRRAELKDVASPEAYSFIILRNQCLDFLRSPRANRREAQIDDLQLPGESSPAQRLEEADALKVVRQLIEQLPEKQKIVLKLKELSHCSPQEIETLTGFSAVHIRTLLLRARRTLKEQYTKLNSYERQSD